MPCNYHLIATPGCLVKATELTSYLLPIKKAAWARRPNVVIRPADVACDIWRWHTFHFCRPDGRLKGSLESKWKAKQERQTPLRSAGHKAICSDFNYEGLWERGTLGSAMNHCHSVSLLLDKNAAHAGRLFFLHTIWAMLSFPRRCWMNLRNRCMLIVLDLARTLLWSIRRFQDGSWSPGPQRADLWKLWRHFRCGEKGTLAWGGWFVSSWWTFPLKVCRTINTTAAVGMVWHPNIPSVPAALLMLIISKSPRQMHHFYFSIAVFMICDVHVSVHFHFWQGEAEFWLVVFDMADFRWTP